MMKILILNIVEKLKNIKFISVNRNFILMLVEILVIKIIKMENVRFINVKGKFILRLVKVLMINIVKKM